MVFKAFAKSKFLETLKYLHLSGTEISDENLEEIFGIYKGSIAK